MKSPSNSSVSYYVGQSLQSRNQPKFIDRAEISRHIRVLFNLKVSDTCLSLKLSGNGQILAVSLANGQVNVFETKRPNLIFELNKKGGKNVCASTAIRFCQAGSNGDVSENLIASFTDGRLKTFNYPTEELLNEIELKSEILALDYSPFGSTFAASSGDGILSIFDSQTQKIINSFKPQAKDAGEFKRVYSLVYSPLGETELISGGWENCLKFYDLRIGGKFVRKIEGPHIVGDGLDISPNGKIICSASWCKTDPVQLWDYSNGKLLKNFVNFENQNQSENVDLKSSKNDKKNRKNSKIPSRLFYSCKFFKNSENGQNFLALGGIEGNSMCVLDYNTEKVQSWIKSLDHSVFDVDTAENNKIGFITGNEFALNEIYQTTLKPVDNSVTIHN